MSTSSTTDADNADIWRPYEDEPVLTPAMTGGPRTTPPGELDRLRRYLEAVVDDRGGGPVHTAVAFNAAYFGYEPGGEGYGNGAFDINTFPSLTLGDETPALPVGALVCIETGSDPLFAEIIYKEGRHPRLEGGADVPAWVSGAPAGANGPDEQQDTSNPVRQELLVPDFTVFGPGLQLPDVRINRFRARQKWLDKDGHVVVGARYTSAEAAALDDTTAFVHHLLTHQRESLLSPLVPVSIVQLADGKEDQRLRDALAGLLDTVGYALHTSDKLRSWRHYALARTRIGAGLCHDGPLGGADLYALTCSLERAAAPSVRRRHGMQGPRTVYTAIAPWLRGVDGAEPLLTGVEYAVSVCRANLAVADFVRRETENGLSTGSGVRITLDDAFENGGIWRSHHPGADEADGSDPLTPAGRGWRDTVAPPEPATPEIPEQRTAEEETTDAEDHADETEQEAPLLDEEITDEAIGPQHYIRIHDSELSWQIPLRLAHLLEARLPLNRMVRDGLSLHGVDNLTVRLELRHPGGMLDASEEVQQVTLDLTSETGMLHGIQWPIDFFPGLRLYIQWPRGGSVFRLSTVELEDPVEIDGQLIAHRYDPQVLTRDSAPGSSRDGDSSAGLDIRRLVLRAVRRFGRLTPDGHALLDRAALPRGIYAATPAAHQTTALEQAVDELLAERKLYAAIGSRGGGRPTAPSRPRGGTRDPADRLRAEPRGGASSRYGRRRAHDAHGHGALRPRLPATAAQGLEAHPRTAGRLPRVLPSHRKGRRLGTARRLHLRHRALPTTLTTRPPTR